MNSSRSNRPTKHLAWLAATLMGLAACGGGGGGGGGGFPLLPPGGPGSTDGTGSPGGPGDQPTATTFTLGGTLAGLSGGKLVLQNNAGDDLSLTANGPFSFATPLARGATYAVTVGRQPAWQHCVVTNGAGQANAEIKDLTASCSALQAQVSTLAGTGTAGSVDGNADVASFNFPTGVALDSAGNVYVNDSLNRVIRKITPAGQVSTLTSPASTFSKWVDLAADAAGNLYLADTVNNRIHKVTPAGQVSILAGKDLGSTNANGENASFNTPSAVAVDAAGNVYVADTDNHLIRKITPARDVTTLAGAGPAQPGAVNGNGVNASFNRPSGLTVDAAGNVYVADSGNNLIRKITPAGDVSTLAGSGKAGSDNGSGLSATFANPSGIALDADGTLYVGTGKMIRKVSSSGDVTTLVDSTALKGTLTLAVGADGHLYVADRGNNQIRKITPAPAP